MALPMAITSYFGAGMGILGICFKFECFNCVGAPSA
jgi:hypothetical protein